MSTPADRKVAIVISPVNVHGGQVSIATNGQIGANRIPKLRQVEFGAPALMVRILIALQSAL